jgi:HEPN domain-containing protein
MKARAEDEASRWLDSAVNDLESAEWDLQGKFYHYACFKSQQSAEKALKAFLYFKGSRKVIGHSTHDLLHQCIHIDPSFEALRDDCTELDLHYLPSRYPNSLPGGVPHRFYTKAKGEEAVACARRVLQKVKESTLP